jgi:hypothetical protein
MISEPLAPESRNVRRAVRRLLDAVDRALAAAREVEAARTALEQTSQRTLRLRCEQESELAD